MFNKKNEINQNKINNEYLDKIKSLEEQCESLRSNIYEIKYPKGKLVTQHGRWGFRKLAYKYVKNDRIKEISITDIDGTIKEYKTKYCDNNVYIGIKYDENNKDLEKYYIVDKNKSVAIECNPEDVFKNSEWVAYDNQLAIN